jgi:hypothetical protein
MPRLNGKFVSKAVFDAAAAAETEEPVTDTTPEAVAEPIGEVPVEEPKVRNVSPLVLATRELTKAKKVLDAAVKRAEKVKAVHEAVEFAEKAYEKAKAEVQKHI